MAEKKSKSNFYFTNKTEDAIVLYNNIKDQRLRSKLYREQIEKPLNKLVENIINRFKFPYVQETSEDLQAEVVSFLITKINQYDQDIGKAFSFLSIIAKNYLILNNKGEYKYRQIKQRIDLTEGEHAFDVIDDAQEKHFNDDIPEFIQMFIEYWEINLSYVFTKRQEIMIADAIITLFRHNRSIENFNKKALYLMIREMTGLRTQYITSVVNKMKKYTKLLEESYNSTGYVDMNKYIDDD